MAARFVALALLLALIPRASWGQPSALRGSLVDTTTHTPVPAVQVKLWSSPDSSQTFRATTGADGAFEFASLPAGTWTLLATRVGYAALRRAIQHPAGLQDLGALPMQPMVLELPEVTVRGSPPPAVQQGDTIVFSGAAVKTHPDATAEELVQKLPGITVDDAGTVKSNGETVQQVLVNGRPFFGTDAALALQNLPADEIDKIQVFDKLSDQAEFTGFDDGQAAKTMNLILRTDRPTTFGKAYAGRSADGRYQAGGNATMLYGDTRLAAIGLANNINQQNFSSQDLLGVLNAGNQQGGKAGSRSGKGRGGRGDADAFLVGPEDGITTTQALGLQGDGQLGHVLDVSQSYFFNHGDNHNRQSIDRQFVAPMDSITRYAQELSTAGRSYDQRLDGRLTWMADSSVIDVPRLYFQGHTVGRDVSAENDRASGAPTSASENRNDNRASGHDLRNHLLLRRRFGAGRTLSVDFGLVHTLKDAGGFLHSTLSSATATGSETDTLAQRSSFNTTSASATARMVYTQPLGKKSMLEASVAPGVTSARSVHDATQTDPRGALPGEEALLNGDFRSTSASQAAGIGYLSRRDGLKLTLGVDVQRSTLRSERIAPGSRLAQRTDYVVLPNVQINDNLPNHRNLRLSWTGATRPPSITQLRDVIDNGNPLLITMGNPDLRQPYSQTWLARYSATDPARSRSMFLLALLQKTDRAIGNATWTAARDTQVLGVPLPRGVQLVTPANVGRNWNASAFFVSSRPVAPLKSILNLQTGASWSLDRGFLNQQFNTTNSYALSQGVVLASNISPSLDFIVSYTGTYNIVQSALGNRDTRYFSQSTRLRLDVLTRNGVTVRQEISHSLLNGVASGYAQDLVLWNSSVGEKLFANRVDVRFTATDLLTQNRSTSRTVTDTYLEDTRNETLPRYLMLTATYTWGP